MWPHVVCKLERVYERLDAPLAASVGRWECNWCVGWSLMYAPIGLRVCVLHAPPPCASLQTDPFSPRLRKRAS